MHWIILGAAIIGLSLGLLGSGGSILTVPILTYLLGMPEKTAVASSLAIVGGISLFGALPLLRRGLVDGRALLAFGPPSMLGTVAGAWLAQRLPEGSQLLIFAPVMLVAAWRMASGGAASVQGPRKSAWAIALAGIGVGLLTGLVGIGGGFLIVPALVLLLGLPMPRAVATSLLLIVLNSAVGFGKYLMADSGQLQLDPTVIGLFIAIGGAASMLGGRLGTRVPQALLRRIFAVVLVLVAVSILLSKFVSFA